MTLLINKYMTPPSPIITKVLFPIPRFKHSVTLQPPGYKVFSNAFIFIVLNHPNKLLHTNMCLPLKLYNLKLKLKLQHWKEPLNIYIYYSHWANIYILYRASFGDFSFLFVQKKISIFSLQSYMKLLEVLIHREIVPIPSWAVTFHTVLMYKLGVEKAE